MLAAVNPSDTLATNYLSGGMTAAIATRRYYIKEAGRVLCIQVSLYESQDGRLAIRGLSSMSGGTGCKKELHSIVLVLSTSSYIHI